MAISTPKQSSTAAALDKAEETLADPIRLVLNEQQWKDFMEALDRPAQTKPRLKKLFLESHVAKRRIMPQLPTSRKCT